jgi:hypothetical protein
MALRVPLLIWRARRDSARENNNVAPPDWQPRAPRPVQTKLKGG